jgi:hypothetical protein
VRPGLRARVSVGQIGLPAAAFVFACAELVWQVRGRSWLLWDEAARVDAGQGLAFALHSGSAVALWNWINDQTLYPFLSAALNGLLIFLGADPLTAAWIPSVTAYVAIGLLAARLAKVCGASLFGQWLAALLCWTAPLEARLGAGAFAEPLGACAYLCLLLLIIAVYREPRARTAILIAIVVAATSWMKWDYGIAALPA